MLANARRLVFLKVLSLTLCCIGTASAGHASSTDPKRFPWDLRPQKCFVNQDVAQFPPCVHENDWPTYSETIDRVATLLVDPDFDLIQRAEKDLAFSTERFPTGEYYFDAWFQGLRRVLQNNHERGGEVVAAWAVEKEHDDYLKLAEAIVRYGEAWELRGGGYARTVSQEAWELYFEKLRQTNAALDSASPKLRRSGPWHVMKLAVAFQLPAVQKSRIQLFTSAIAAWPDYERLYLTAMSFSHPRWGGSFEEMDEVARIAAENTRAEQGAGLYSVLYESAFRGDSKYTLQDSKVDWALMKQGFRDLERKDGPSWRWKNFAQNACQMRDQQEAQRLYFLHDKTTKSSSPASADALDPCRVFAMGRT